MAGRPKKTEDEKLVSVGLSLSPEQEKELKEIAAHEDREAGYIKRILYLRGLAAYKQDGVLREPSNSFTVRITPQVNPNLQEELRASAHLRGMSVASVLHNYAAEIVESDRKLRPAEFSSALEFIGKVGPDPEGNKIYGSITFAGSTELKAEATVTQASQSGDEPKSGETTQDRLGAVRKEVKKGAKKRGRNSGTKR